MLDEPSWTWVVLRVGFLLFLWYATSSIAAWSKLRHVPGPVLASFSYIWLTRQVATGKSDYILEAEQKKHGRVMRIGPDAVVIYDPDTLMRINNVRTAYTRGPWYSTLTFDSRGHNVVTLLDRAKHIQRRATLHSGLGPKNLANLERSIDNWHQALVRKLRDNIAKGDEVMDISLIIQQFQVDLVFEAGIGKPWGYLSGEKVQFDYLKVAEEAEPPIHTLCTHPWARAVYSSRWLMDLIGPKTTDKAGLGFLLGIIEKEVHQRFSNKEKGVASKTDMLGQWIDHGLTPEECQYDMAFMVPAGADTTVTAIRGILLYLMTSPVLYQKVKKEIRDGIKDGRISEPVTNEQAKSLEYIQAVIREGLRLVVPINFGFPKRVPPAGDTICGVFLPGGTDVYYNNRSMMRNEEVFGTDANIFRPERYLESNGLDVGRMIKTVDLAFGYGGYMCLGKSFAMIELNKFFIELFRNFDFQLANPEHPWRREGYTTVLIHNFLVKVTEDRIE
ncbi:cytochrome P450 [Poronia punctata]|nr:cytochrome P450 [Poronia punctata]